MSVNFFSSLLHVLKNFLKPASNSYVNMFIFNFFLYYCSISILFLLKKIAFIFYIIDISIIIYFFLSLELFVNKRNKEIKCIIAT